MQIKSQVTAKKAEKLQENDRPFIALAKKTLASGAHALRKKIDIFAACAHEF